MPAEDADLARLTEIATDLHRLFQVQVTRSKVEIRELVLRSLGWLVQGAFLLSLALIASLYLMRGLSSLVAALMGDRPWAGDLASAGLALVIVAGVGLAVRGNMRRKSLKHMRAQYDSKTTEAE